MEDRVSHLITVASQAGFFYEVDGLVSLPFPQALPGHFPGRWLNIYDRSDFLSYRGEGAFPGRCTDLEVASGQPFQQAHSAYWENPDVFRAIGEFAAG